MQSMAAVRLLPRSRPLLSSFGRASTAAGAGDPRIHSEDPEDDDAVEAAKYNYAEQLQQQQAPESGRPKPPPPTDRTPPFGSSPRLERSEVIPPANYSFQQRRRWSSTTRPPPLDDVTCDVGWDGGVDWPGAQQEEENRAYFAGRKATPLSEVEFADTRKPIGRAWDKGEAGEDVVGLVVEDSVDAALERAEKMFLDAKVRGDPNTPWGQVVWRKKRVEDVEDRNIG